MDLPHIKLISLYTLTMTVTLHSALSPFLLYEQICFVCIARKKQYFSLYITGEAGPPTPRYGHMTDTWLLQYDRTIYIQGYRITIYIQTVMVLVSLHSPLVEKQKPLPTVQPSSGSLPGFVDLDGNLLVTNDPFVGAQPNAGRLSLPSTPGLGVERRL